MAVANALAERGTTTGLHLRSLPSRRRVGLWDHLTARREHCIPARSRGGRAALFAWDSPDLLSPCVSTAAPVPSPADVWASSLPIC